jgi:enterochelin esterase-like enzyme
MAVVLLLSACSPVIAPNASTPTATPFSETQPSSLSTSLTKETQTAAVELTKEACLAAGGAIEQLSIESQLLEHPLAFRVYTPPCYAEHTDERYPVIYMIHGQTYNDDQWDRLGADETATELIASGEVPPFLIVMPADASHFTQPSANAFDESVVEELIPWIDEHYRTLAERRYRAMGGLSRGASWAIHLALTHPELFGSLAGHSPPVFQEDASRVRGWLDSIPASLMPRVWLDIGQRDQSAILESAIWFEGLLDERDIPHEWSLFTGDHSEAYWSSHVEQYLRWYAAEW